MNIKYKAIAAIASSVLFASCMSDLDTKPLNDHDFTSEQAYNSPESYKQGLAKIYGSFVLVGSDSGSSEISVSDAGASELNRAFWSLQEIAADAVKCAWNDAWVTEINTNTWSTAKNDAIFAAYNRIMMGVSYVNEYLRQTSDGSLSGREVDQNLYNDIQVYRAEARFVRAYVYWMGLDLFQNMPLVKEDDPLGSFYPPQASGSELFEYIESELLDLVSESSAMKEANQNVYPRVDKAAAWGLLARMYLNAEVYTGTAKWNEAKTAAGKAIGTNYSLASNYLALFSADNGSNPDAAKELLFAIDYHHEKTKSYGGTTYIIASAMQGENSEGKTLIGSDGWAGNRMPGDFALNYFDISNVNYDAGTFDCDDNRAMFWIKERTQEIDVLNDFSYGWNVTKFRNIALLTGERVGLDVFSSTDFPMIRLAEMHLIYAEAALRAGTSNDATAIGYLNDLRSRSLGSAYTPITTYDIEYIKAERAREFYWEGHRRTDLRRYGDWLAGNFRWSWKGGVLEGKALDSRFGIYPIPTEDLAANHNLEQNPGYE